jgi:hypothetical protein
MCKQACLLADTSDQRSKFCQPLSWYQSHRKRICVPDDAAHTQSQSAFALHPGLEPKHSAIVRKRLAVVAGRLRRNQGHPVASIYRRQPHAYDPNFTPTENGQLSDQRRLQSGCTVAQPYSCTFSSVGEIAGIADSTYNAMQVSLKKRFSGGLSWLPTLFPERLTTHPLSTLPVWLHKASREKTTSLRIHSIFSPSVAVRCSPDFSARRRNIVGNPYFGPCNQNGVITPAETASCWVNKTAFQEAACDLFGDVGRNTSERSRCSAEGFVRQQVHS